MSGLQDPVRHTADWITSRQARCIPSAYHCILKAMYLTTLLGIFREI